QPRHANSPTPTTPRRHHKHPTPTHNTDHPHPRHQPTHDNNPDINRPHPSPQPSTPQQPRRSRSPKPPPTDPGRPQNGPVTARNPARLSPGSGQRRRQAHRTNPQVRIGETEGITG